MNKLEVVLLGIVNAIPLTWWTLSRLFEDLPLSIRRTDYPAHYGLMFEMVLLWIAVCALITLVAIALALTDRRLAWTRRAVWAIALLFLNIAALPVFWYVCIWRPFRATQHNNAIDGDAGIGVS